MQERLTKYKSLIQYKNKKIMNYKFYEGGDVTLPTYQVLSEQEFLTSYPIFKNRNLGIMQLSGGVFCAYSNLLQMIESYNIDTLVFNTKELQLEEVNRLVDIERQAKPKLTVKEKKIEEIRGYDQSEVVNEFTIDGVSMWLDKNTRAGLKLRFDVEKTSGMIDTSLWFGTLQIPLNIDTAMGLLMQVELYASQCYDITQQHIANVEALTTDQQIEDYNYKTGYPEKLVF